MNIGIVGGGRGGLAVLTLLLTIPEVNILWFDVQDDAPAFPKAEAAGIRIVKDLFPSCRIGFDLVIEVTGVAAVRAC